MDEAGWDVWDEAVKAGPSSMLEQVHDELVGIESGGVSATYPAVGSVAVGLAKATRSTPTLIILSEC